MNTASGITMGSEGGMPNSAMGRIGPMSSIMMSSERKPLNVINGGVS